eukprot:15477623-Alexandrium_andersonii.AAC.1
MALWRAEPVHPGREGSPPTLPSRSLAGCRLGGAVPARVAPGGPRCPNRERSMAACASGSHTQDDRRLNFRPACLGRRGWCHLQ